MRKREFLYSEEYFLSDLGLFSILYYYGLVGFLIYLFIIKKNFSFTNHGTSLNQNFINNYIVFQFAAPNLFSLDQFPAFMIFLIAYTSITLYRKNERIS